jgi:Tol biopolymer transport system component
MKCSVVAVVAVSLLAGCTSRGDDETSAGFIVLQYGGSVRTVDIDGADPSVLTDETPTGQERPDWSPDGRRIVFETEFDQLWTATSDGTDVSRVFECDDPCQVVQDGSCSLATGTSTRCRPTGATRSR